MDPVTIFQTYLPQLRLSKAKIATEYTGMSFELDESMVEKVSKSFGKASFDFKEYESKEMAYYTQLLLIESTFLGANKDTKEEILQWINFSQNELIVNVEGWIYPILGYVAFVEPLINLHIEKTKKAMNILNKALENKEYIVGDSITLADISLFFALVFPYKFVFDKEFRDGYKNVDRYVNKLASEENFQKHLILEYCETPLKYTSTKKEKKKKKKKTDTPKKINSLKEEEKKVVKTDQEAVTKEVETKPTSKPRSKLDLLAPSTFILDAWKREYSNNDTDVAMDWFWRNFDAYGYSIWKVDYKYNDELTMTFMSNNLIGGFYNRLELAHKYAFASMVVCGENNKNKVSGIFVIRGQDVPFEIYNAADYDCFNFSKIDMSEYEERKDEINRYMAWNFDDFAAGKVFK